MLDLILNFDLGGDSEKAWVKFLDLEQDLLLLILTLHVNLYCFVEFVMEVII